MLTATGAGHCHATASAARKRRLASTRWRAKLGSCLEVVGGTRLLCCKAGRHVNRAWKLPSGILMRAYLTGFRPLTAAIASEFIGDAPGPKDTGMRINICVPPCSMLSRAEPDWLPM